MTRPPDRVILFSCADRFGREIVLYEDTWYDHILARRSILAGHEMAVLATLEAVEFDAERRQGIVATAFTVDGPNPHERWEH